MDGFELVCPTKEYQAQAADYIHEFREHHSAIHGVGGLDRFDDYDTWLENVRNYMDYYFAKPGCVPGSTLFFVRKSDNRIVGMTSIRYRLNDHLLRESGHIGYSIRPTERNQGYGTHLLTLALAECDKMGIDRVLVTCDKSNIGSAKVIQNNNGVLENEVVNRTTGKIVQRYWIDVKKALARI